MSAALGKLVKITTTEYKVTNTYNILRHWQHLSNLQCNTYKTL